MKFLHCSDIHLGRRPAGAAGEYSRKRFDDYFDAFEWAVNLAVERKLDAFIISGDFFDKKELHPEVIERAEKILNKLKEVNIPVVLTEGNHDNISSGFENESWLVYLQNKGLFNRPVTIFSDSYQFSYAEISDIRFFGLGYPGSFAKEVLVAFKNYLDEMNIDKCVLLVHTAIGSSMQFPGTIEKDVIYLFKDKDIYIAGGHFHFHHVYPTSKPLLYIPGSLEYWDSNEFAQKKGVIIYDTDTSSYEFTESQKRHAINLEITVNSEIGESLYEKLEEEIAKQEIIQSETLFKLTIYTEELTPDTGKIEEILSKYGVLKSFVKIIFPGNYMVKDIKDPNLTISQIESELINSWDVFSSKAELSSELLNGLKEAQMNENQDSFYLIFEQLMENFISEAAK